MGFMDKMIGEFRFLAHPEDDDDEVYDEVETVEPRSLERKERRSYTRETEVEREKSRSRSYEPEVKNRGTRERDTRNAQNIVELQTRTLQQVVIMEPKEYEEVKTIADYLCNKFTIFLNLEQTDAEISTRILDFISGVAYANQGMVRRVAEKTFVATPFTVNLIDSLMDGLENEGIFFKT